MTSTTPFRTIQGLGSATFSIPPLNGSLTVPEIFKFHAQNSPHHPLFVYADDGGKEVVITHAQAWGGMKQAAQIVWNSVQRSSGKSSLAPGKPPIIGILASADSISYASLIVGVTILGYTVFPISIRNSAAAVAHLAKSVGMKYMVVSADAPMQRLYRDAMGLLAKDGLMVKPIPMFQFDDLFHPTPKALDAPENFLGSDEVSLLMHSSGSTSFPKPVYGTAKTWMQFGTLFHWGDVDVCGLRISTHAIPMFHAMGTIMLAAGACAGLVLAMFKPTTPPPVPTPERFFEGLVATKCNIGYSVPSIVETLSCDPKTIPVFRDLKIFIFGAAPLNRDVADKLIDAGVNMAPIYGATELGCIDKLIPRERTTKETCDYFKFAGNLGVHLRPQEDRDDVFEFVAVETEMLTPCMSNTTVDGKRAYATNDLVQRHPKYPDMYRLYGRVDDQIMLSTGEKTNPGPIEIILTRNPRVKAALMFGRGKFQNGVLVQPEEGYEFDPADVTKLEQFRNAIWPSVEKANEIAPSHSRLFKEMIITTHPDKPFLWTAKGTPRGKVSLAQYDKEIEALYDTVADASQTDIEPPAKWTPELTVEFVRTVVRRVMSVPPGDEEDLFQAGCDSLQATWIRNSLTHAVRVASSVSVSSIPGNYVYAHPSIAKLAKYLVRLCGNNAQGADAETTQAEHVELMKQLVAKYTSNLPIRRVSNGSGTTDSLSPANEIVLLTGSTGRFGSYMLAQMLTKDTVVRVFALNRGAQDSIVQRQRDAFIEWDLDPALVDSGRLVLLTGEISQPKLGLEAATYEEIRRQITSIIHNAWRLDFNVSLSSNEPLIAGVRRLIDLSLTSPRATAPHILFTSSIGLVLNGPNVPLDRPILEEPLPDPRVAVGTGYTESKWVAERILDVAWRETGLPVTVVRVGQLASDSRTGAWNKKEWFPTFVRAGQIMGCLAAKGGERVTWLCTDVAAAAALEMTHSDYSVLHLVNPYPAEWGAIVQHVSARLGLPLVPYEEWIELLRAAARRDMHGKNANGKSSNPATMLVEFFEAGVGERVQLATDKAMKVSKTLRETRPYGDKEVDAFIKYGQATGFLD